MARSDLLRRQFDLTWALLEPTALCWRLHPDGHGGWTPDWADTEPDPVPVPMIAWVSRHLGWWWSVTLDHLGGRTPRERADVAWPGTADGTATWLRGLRDEWTAVLADGGLDAPATFPWPPGSGLTVAHTVAWVNAELMKNSAEIGLLRLSRRVGRAPGRR